MGNKNAFLAEQERKQQWCLDTGIERGMQSIIDYMCIALNDPEVMGKNVMGKSRLTKLNAKLTEIANYYETAFTDDVEADYVQEQLDRRLREIFGDDFRPFHERYPYFKKIRYNKAKKNWR